MASAVDDDNSDLDARNPQEHAPKNPKKTHEKMALAVDDDNSKFDARNPQTKLQKNPQKALQKIASALGDDNSQFNARNPHKTPEKNLKKMTSALGDDNSQLDARNSHKTPQKNPQEMTSALGDDNSQFDARNSHKTHEKNLQEMASALDEDNSDFDAEPDLLTEQFNSAASHVKALADKLAEKQLLLLYGAYKRATVGKCTTPRPRWYEMQAKVKWDAWHALDDVSQQDAKETYVRLVQDFDPSWEPLGKSGGDNWAAVSSLLPSDCAIDEDDKTLIDFVKEGNVPKVRTMLGIIEKGTPAFRERVNDLDEDGLGMIHWAADRGSADMLRCLLEFGVDVNCADSSGQTALHYAASCGHFACAELLLAKGADVGVKDEDGLKAADVSSENCVTELLRNAA